MSLHPVQVRYLQEQALLKIEFSNGAQIDYPTKFLRGFCPCAKCQGHSAGPPSWVAPEHMDEVTIDDVTPVGNYAMCIVWADGHDTGIYAFDNLWRMGQQVLAGLEPEHVEVQGLAL